MNSSTNMVIAVIPARGGSKRIPKKNILPFFGHPMIAYTIRAALNSGLFHRVVVSTDDAEIGAVAQNYGAEFLLRPAELATDESGLVGVSRHVLDALAANGETPDAICQLMPNCPLRRSDDIAGHFETFRNENRSFQISVVPYRAVYPQWALTENAHGEGNWVFGDGYLVRSQDLGSTWCPTGAIWWAKVADFLRQETFYGNPFHLAEIDANRGIDIDTPDELDMADLLVRGLEARSGSSCLEPIVLSPNLRNARQL